MAAIETMISIWPMFLVEHQEVKLISKLNSFFNFDHNIFLIDTSMDMDGFINRQEAIPQSIYSFETVHGNITGLESLRNIQSKNTIMLVVADGADFHSNLNLLKKIKEIQQLQTKMKIGIFLPKFSTSQDLKQLLKWCKEQLIVNIFAATYTYPDVLQEVTSGRKLNIFTFHPFGTFEVTNLTGVSSYGSYFLCLNSNFQQHQLRVRPFYNYADETLWLTVFQLMNASFVPVRLAASYDDHPWLKLVEKQIDIVPVLYRVIGFTGNSATLMYPLRMGAQIIIVPEALPYSDFFAYLQTVTSSEFNVYAIIAIATVTLLLSAFRYIKQKKILLFQSVADVLNLLMNDNGHIKYQRLSCVEVFVIVPLTFVGLFIVNGILSNLKSYRIQPSLQPEINSIEEVYKSPFPIQTFNEVWKNKLIDELTNLTKHKDWIHKIFVLKKKEYHDQLDMYNTSNSFLIYKDTAKRLIEVQKRLKIRGFYNPQIEMFNYLAAYIVFEKFIFFERLDEIVHWIQSAGLYDLWHRQQISKWKTCVLAENDERLKNQTEIIVENFEFPMFVVYGWVTGAITLVIEIIWKNFKLLRIK